VTERRRRGLDPFVVGPIIVGLIVATVIVWVVSTRNAEVAEIESSLPAPIEAWQTSGVVAGDDNPVKAYINELGGTEIEVRLVGLSDRPCRITETNEETVTGCVVDNTPRAIYFTPSVAQLPPERMRPLVAHELAHIYQLDLADDYLVSNAAVIAAYGSGQANELMADCMAFIQTGSTTGAYTDTCTPEQIEVGNKVWAGQLP